MKKKYFSKNQSILQRKFIAGGLAATFAFGTVGSGLAGAMKENDEVYYFNENINKLVNDDNPMKNKKAELMGYIPDTAEEILKIILGGEENYKSKSGNYEFDPGKVIDDKIKEKILEKFINQKANNAAKVGKKLEDEDRKNFLESLTKEELEKWFRNDFLETKGLSDIIKEKEIEIKFDSDDFNPLNLSSEQFLKTGKEKLKNGDYEKKSEKNKVNKKVLIAIVSIFIIAVIVAIIYACIATRSSGSAKIDEGSSSKKEEQNGQGEPADNKQPESKEEKDGKGTESAKQDSVSSNLVKWGVGTAGGLFTTSLVAAKDIYSKNGKNSGVLNSVENKTETKKESSEYDSKLIGSKDSDAEGTDKKTDDSENSKEEKIETKE